MPRLRRTFASRVLANLLTGSAGALGSCGLVAARLARLTWYVARASAWLERRLGRAASDLTGSAESLRHLAREARRDPRFAAENQR